MAGVDELLAQLRKLEVQAKGLESRLAWTRENDDEADKRVPHIAKNLGRVMEKLYEVEQELAAMENEVSGAP